jgi:hypothetical protein
MVMAVAMGGAIAAVGVTTMVGGEVAAITTAGRAVVIAAGIKIHTRSGRLSWRPLHLMPRVPRGAAC